LKIGEFGLAVKKSATGSQSAWGSVYYLPPEVVEKGDSDEKIDIWALGCVLLQLCVPKRDWACHGLPAMEALQYPDRFELLLSSVGGFKSSYPLQVISNVTSLLRLMLQKDPKKRPSAEMCSQQSFLRESIAAAGPLPVVVRCPSVRRTKGSFDENMLPQVASA
jgi:serine/threonine protein kinase